MKRFFLSVALTLVLGSPSYAGLKIIGSGNAMRLDPSGFPPDMKERYEKIMEVRCVRCHSLERVITALKTGVAPISGQTFDKITTEAYSIRMMRMPNSQMTKEETKAVIELLNFLLDEAARSR
jgi:hypothetical protein